MDRAKSISHKHLKDKNCKECGKLFKPYRTTQKTCSYKCAIELSKKKVWEQEKKKRIDEIRTRSEWMSLAQKVFNAYIRHRDKWKECISCTTILNEDFDAGHFHSSGNHKALTFDEFNVHGQCQKCNRFLHGNLLEYQKKLLMRVGFDQIKRLDEKKNEHKKWSKDELKEIILKYKAKIKEL